MPSLKIFGKELNTDHSKLWRWMLKGGIAIADQGLFSGSNFVLNVLLARWLNQGDYGYFAIIFGFFLFLSGFHNALILEPMTILGPARHAGELVQYVLAQVKIHFIFTGILGFLLAVSGWFFRTNIELSSGLVWAGVALPFMLFAWLVRRIFYVLQMPRGALICSVFYSITLLGGLALWPSKSISNSYILMGAASFISALLALWIGKNGLKTVGSTNLNTHRLIVDQWEYGKPIFIATFLFTLGAQIQLFITATFIDVESAGVWRAMQNFSLPMQQVITAIAVLVLPNLSAEYGRFNIKKMKYKGYIIMAILVGLAIVYELLLLIFPTRIEWILYNGKMADNIWLIPLIGIVTIITAIEYGFSLVVRGMQRPIYHIYYGITSVLAGIIISPIFIAKWHLGGAVASQILSGIIVLAVTIIMYINWVPKRVVDRQ